MVTSSGLPLAAGVVVLSDDGTRILAIRSEKKNPGGYGLPFGKVSVGEPILAAASRELAEETGKYADELEVLFEAPCNGFHSVTYLARRTSGVVQSSAEGVAEWVRPEQLLTGLYADYNAGVLDALRARGILVDNH